MNHATSYRTGLIVLALVAGGIAAAPGAAFAADATPPQPAPVVQVVGSVGWDCSFQTAYELKTTTTTTTTLVGGVWVASAPTVVAVRQDFPSTFDEMLTYCGIAHPKMWADSQWDGPLSQAELVPVIAAKAPAPTVAAPTVAVPSAPVTAKVAVKAPATVSHSVTLAAPIAAPAPVVAAAAATPAVIAPTVVSVPADLWAACDYLICV